MLKNTRRKIWRYAHANFDHACELLASTDWASLFESSSVNVCWDIWHSKFLEIMTESIPLVEVKSRRNLPWLSKAVTQAIKKRNALFRAAKRFKDRASYQRYRASRNRVVALLHMNKSKYFKDLQNNDSKAFWKAIKLLNKQKSLIPPLLSPDGSKKAENSKEKATLLNLFFHECFNRCLLPLAPQPSFLYPDDCPAYLLCSEGEVFDLISSLDASKSSGPDGISARMLKEVSSSVTPPLTKLFNLSLSTGILPDSWKIARIVPIPKSTQNTTSPSNYRPISILPLVSKLLEKHVHKLLFHHLCESYPISRRQWGFLPGRSAQSALLSVTHDWFQQLENGNEVCCIFFDLKKAFDSVPHSVLLQKLSAIGVDPYIIQWIRNYLTCRSQYVVIDGEQSCMLPVVSGVPQGSVLGPLLFLVFINEVVDQVSMDSFMSLLLMT